MNAATTLSLRRAGVFAVCLAIPALPLGAARVSHTPAPAAGSQCRLNALWDVAAEPSRRLALAGVPDFGRLNDHVWRSGQPSVEGYRNLASLGLKTVVDLRRETAADADPVPAGVKLVYIPIRDEQPPTPEQAGEFLAIASNPANWPVLVHCQGGEGRAGVMGAILRHSVDGWDDRRIEREVSNFRVAHLGFIRTRMPGTQRAFIRDWEASHEAGEYLQHVVQAP